MAHVYCVSLPAIVARRRVLNSIFFVYTKVDLSVICPIVS